MSDTIGDYTTAPIPAGRKAVLLFWAEWHEACVEGGPMDTVLKALAGSASDKAVFGRVHAEENDNLSFKYNVTAVPTFVLLNEAGVVVEKVEGDADVSQVTQAVQRLLSAAPVEAATPSATSTTATATLTPEQQLSQRLDRLINSNEVMLFIKGNPTAPRCGFSRQAIEMLQSENIPFGSFDILLDETVRQGLKKHSNWPTYPQLYVRGELIGGLDILKEMKEEGPLRDQFGITATTAAPMTLEERCKALIQQERVMLFMKGLPSTPRCGFSRQMVELLDAEGIAYGAFDILQDEEVREGLKKLSDWPTYPQLYVGGELIGGLDIVKEMKEDGSLKDALGK